MQSVVEHRQLVLFKKKEFHLDKLDRGVIAGLETQFVHLRDEQYRYRKAFHNVDAKTLPRGAQATLTFLQRECDRLFAIFGRAATLAHEAHEYLEVFNAEEVKLHIFDLDECVQESRVVLHHIKALEEDVKKQAHDAPFIRPQSTSYDEQYLIDKEKFNAMRGQIEATEAKIVSQPYDKRLHEEMIYGKYKSLRHARINDNLRILYAWDASRKLLVYKRVITHTELEQSQRTSM
jgi:mRNA-degrading endonuclease YafQ of YafQ-DinJ toxin-antitoxin module